MEVFWFFPLQFRQAYNSAYDSKFWLSLGHKLSYKYQFDSDSIASENQPLVHSVPLWDKREWQSLSI